MSPMDGKVVAITGAANGIALAAAHVLTSRGATVCLADIKSDALDRAAASITSACKAEKVDAVVRKAVIDVSKRADVDGWIEGIVKEFGKIDGGVNFAGIQDIGGLAQLQDMSDEHFDKIVAVNFKGVFNCMRAQLKHMKSGGSIVNATSVQVFYALPQNAAYVATKHAVIGLTQTAAKEAGERNIRVNAVAPGAIDTAMTDEMEERNGKLDMNTFAAMRRKGEAEEVAKAIAFLISDESSYISGSVQRVDGGVAL